MGSGPKGVDDLCFHARGIFGEPLYGKIRYSFFFYGVNTEARFFVPKPFFGPFGTLVFERRRKAPVFGTNEENRVLIRIIMAKINSFNRDELSEGSKGKNKTTEGKTTDQK